MDQYTDDERLDRASCHILRLKMSPDLAHSLKVLDVSNNQLLELPTAFFELKCLHTLTVTRNRLQSLPERLPVSLRELNASLNKLTDECTLSLTGLTGLEVLRLGKNQLTVFPPVLSLLTALRTVSLFGNQITRLPRSDVVEPLVALRWLDLSDNCIVTDTHRDFIARFPDCLIDISVPDVVRHGSQYLYIGSEGCARNTPMLKRLQITHILSVCHFETDLSSSYEHLIVPINDDFEARLDFEQTAE